MKNNIFLLSIIVSLFLMVHNTQSMQAPQHCVANAQPKQPDYQKSANAMAMVAAELSKKEICDRLNANNTTQSAPTGTRVQVGEKGFYKHPRTWSKHHYRPDRPE